MSNAYLVDTNVVVWGWHEPHRVPGRLRRLLEADGDFYVSVASIWEICIKAAIGKLVTVQNVSGALLDTGYRILPIKVEHVEAVRYLPLHHRDPYDRLLICQARLEELRLVATDRQFSNYDVMLA
ncbi:MAG: type II toxin-antitoxin system VapC family toxin [Hyphomicrobiales bacterium]|nr:type II toxin-antitoxin system VapC family toxin [Hyphomicrobiales bacterium]